MVIDTSALVAMLNDEPEAQRFEIAVAADHVWLMSTASYPEMATVIETRFGEPGDVNPRSAASLSSIRVTISHVSIFARFSPAEPAMSALLDGVLDAHGGLQRWRAAETVHGRVRTGGLLLRTRVPGNRFADYRITVHVQQARTVLDPFPRDGYRGVFESGQVRIESHDGAVISSRAHPRAAFFGRSGLRRNIRWDPLDSVYFAGYAMWNYLTTPYLLTREGVAVEEGAPWQQEGETWRRLIVSFPPDIDTHSPRQTFTSMPAVSCAATTTSRRSLATGHGQLIIAPTPWMSTGLYSRLAGGSTRSARESLTALPNSGIDPADRHPGRDRLGFAGSRRTSRLLKPLALCLSHHRGWRGEESGDGWHRGIAGGYAVRAVSVAAVGGSRRHGRRL